MKKSLVVFAGLALAAAVLGWFALGRQAEPVQTEGEWRPVNVFRPDSPLQRITIEHAGSKISLEPSSQEGVWMMREPKTALVDMNFIAPLIQGIPKLKKERIILVNPEEEELREKLLSPPDAVLTVDYADGSPPTVLEVGKETYTGDGFSARVAGEAQVFAIDDSLRLFFHADAKTYRSTTLMMQQEAGVVSLEFKILDPAFTEDFPGAYSYRLSRQDTKDDLGWIFTEPFQEQASANAVFYLLRNLSLGVSPEFIDPENGDYVPYGLDKPRAVFTSLGLDGRSERILVGAYNRPQDKVYIRNEARTEVMPVSSSDMIRSFLSNLRRSTILEQAQGYETDRVRIEYPRQGTAPAVLVKKADRYAFVFEDEPGREINYDRVLSLALFLKDQPLGYLRNVPPFDLAAYGLENPRLAMQVSEKGTLFLDVAFGDTVRINGKVNTIILDRIRNCIVSVQADFYEDTPWKLEYLAGE